LLKVTEENYEAVLKHWWDLRFIGPHYDKDQNDVWIAYLSSIEDENLSQLEDCTIQFYAHFVTSKDVPVISNFYSNNNLTMSRL
jgi:hypothetical protein